MNYLEKVNPDCLKEIIKYKKEISKTQQRFKSERHNVFAERNQQDCFKFKW